jgi:hypothetical protein
MNKLVVYYSVINGGDGSAYPHFWESKELAEWDEEHDYEGWAESSVGNISFESDSSIVCLDEITTKEKYLIDEYFEGYEPNENEQQEFTEKFFPSGLPTFRVETEKTSTEYLYNNVFVNNKKVAKMFRNPKDSGESFEEFLNSFK